jgi:hypothetical protein
MFNFCNDAGIFFSNAVCILKHLPSWGTSQATYCFKFIDGDCGFTVIHGNMKIVVWDAVTRSNIMFEHGCHDGPLSQDYSNVWIEGLTKEHKLNWEIQPIRLACSAILRNSHKTVLDMPVCNYPLWITASIYWTCNLCNIFAKSFELALIGAK